MAEQIATKSLIDERATTGAMHRWFVVVRLLVVIVGGYAAASALVAGCARLLPIVGLPRSEAVVLASMFGFLFYLALLVWGFAQARLANLVLGLLLMGAVGVALMLALGD